MKDGGIHFLKTELLELSLVTIPANAEASIATIKAFDVTADFPNTNVKVSEVKPAVTITVQPSKGGATQPGATKQTAASAASRKVKKMTKQMTILEQIGAFDAKRAGLVARMEELMQKAADAGQTLDADESKEYDDADAEVAQIESHIKRLNALEKTNRENAKPVEKAVTAMAGSETRSYQRVTSVKPNVPPGTAMVRYSMALAAARGNRWEALERAKQWDNTPEVALALSVDIPREMSDPQAIIAKAAVGAGTTTDATWASPLIAYQVMASEFIELLRPATIVGRIPGLRRVPFNIQMPAATTGTSMGWVGENAPKPVSNMAFTTVTMRWAKAAGIVVLTDELVRFSNPAGEAIVRGDMIAAMAQFLDRQFVDPTVAAVTNVSPASITNGVSAIHRSGVNQAAFSTDAQALLTLFLNNNISTAGGVWIMSQRQALAFSLMLNALGQPFYPTITATGGTLLGYPVIASENIPSVGGSPADGTPIIFAIAPEILLADDGQVVIDASNQASVNMDSAPDSPPTASTNMVSLWQMNMTGLRAERWINWLKRRSTAVQYIDNAAYA
jgi:HK97 family phage major capsid protein